MSIKRNRYETKKALAMLRLFIEKLQKSLSVLAPRETDLNDFNEELVVAAVVPDYVTEGHFSVFAIKGEETKRFVVELYYLTNPAFLRLLDQAKEEYGFTQKGALTVPCRPEELQKILDDGTEKSTGAALCLSSIKSY
uniref:Auxin-responsive protein n=1 Tax=Fagus sylvatica TaxID=28930 RepID=A0A2N9I581_FAGSY